METSSYGGKWCENLVQASCADLLRNGMFAMEAAGYPSVLTVHDENVTEVPKASARSRRLRR
jgi:DNA polymerase